jgi:hypothetical protein
LDLAYNERVKKISLRGFLPSQVNITSERRAELEEVSKLVFVDRTTTRKPIPVIFQKKSVERIEDEDEDEEEETPSSDELYLEEQERERDLKGENYR